MIIELFAMPDRRQTRNGQILLHVFAAATSRKGLLSFWWRVLCKYSVRQYLFISFWFYILSYHFRSFCVISIISCHFMPFQIILCHFISFQVISGHFISFHIVSISLTFDLMEPWETILFDLCQAHNVTIVPVPFASICIEDILGGLIGTFH